MTKRIVVNAGLTETRVAVQEGLDSGVSDRTMPQIMEGVETRLRANGRL